MPPREADPQALCIVLATAPDAGQAARIARELVERRLAACVNVLSGAASVYRWEGAIEESAEVLMIVKTTRARLAELERALLDLHPYDVPEFVALDAAHVEPRYQAWVRASTC